jgi:EAL domain-containing protein (putative c-di-GMP-specific phosphodiesterase class I)
MRDSSASPNLAARSRSGGLRRQLRRELKRWRWRFPRSSQLGLLTLPLVSAVLAVGLAATHGQRQRQQARLRSDTESGLLELRVNSHKVVATDWGHWDPIFSFARSGDRAVIDQEVNTSSIVHDGQDLLITDTNGTSLYHSREATPPPDGRRRKLGAELRMCLNSTVTELIRRDRQGRGPLNASQQAWGFLCPNDESWVIGAATAITDSGSRQPPRGWLLHYSDLERPSYNPVINASFRDLAAKLCPRDQMPRRFWPWSLHLNVSDVPLINELRSDGAALVLDQPLRPSRFAISALQEVVVPWLLVNALLISGICAALLMLRELRRNRRLDQRRTRRRLREVRRIDGQVGLVSLAEWFDSLENPLMQLGDPGVTLLAQVQLQVKTYAASLPDLRSARDRARRQLVTLLRDMDRQRRLSFSSDSELLLAYPAELPLCPEHEESRLQEVLINLQQQLADQVQLKLSGLITPLVRGQEERLVADLSLFHTSDSSGRGVRFLSRDDCSLASELRRRISTDFDMNRLAQNLTDHGHRAEPILRWHGEQLCEVYQELLFRMPGALASTLPVQELILSLERNGGVHLIDLLMLRRAISLQSGEVTSGDSLGTNLSAVTMASRENRTDLLDLLRNAPEAVRRRLVLEVTETAILDDPTLWGDFLSTLHGLGLRVAIDDFGSGFASLSYLFRFPADFVKVDMQFTQRPGDPDVEAMVAFLLQYGSNHGTAIVMEGVETEAQLSHWRSRGVSHFQGHLFHCSAADKPGGARAAAAQ